VFFKLVYKRMGSSSDFSTTKYHFINHISHLEEDSNVEEKDEKFRNFGLFSLQGGEWM
jgi:hypothetical protein